MDSPIVEKFDPTWPYNFKFGFDAKTAKAHVWRVKGGTDGRPTHRAELRALWGREPQVGQGDVLGLASYIPAEMKIDGTLVAPPTILVQAYYGVEVPDAIFDWFHQNFPDAAVRRARLASIVTGDFEYQPMAEGTYAPLKWIWSPKDGLLLWQAEGNLPSHRQKAWSDWGRDLNDADTFGYATPVDDQVSIDAFHGNSPRAIAAVKDELAKMFPDAHIDTNLKWEQDSGMAHGDPGKLARREAAIAWAQNALGGPSETPVEAPESPVETTNEIPGSTGWLSRLLSKKKVAEADMSGAMVALFLSEEDGKKILIDGGEPLEQLHITLCYFKDKAADRDDWDEVAKLVEQIAAQTPALTGKISGYGVFSNDVDVLWASPSVQGLAELRHKVFEACEDAGFHVSTDHDWAPHITLKYEHKGKLPKLDKEISLDFRTLTFARGEKRDDVEFSGHFEKRADAELDSWGPTRIDCPRCHQGPYSWEALLMHMEQVHGEKFSFAVGMPQDTTPPPPPPAQQAPAPTTTTDAQPPGGVTLPTMQAAPPPVIGANGRPNPVKKGIQYDYANIQRNVSAATFTMTKSQVSAGHVAAWLGAVSGNGQSWIQAGIEHTYGETTPMLYVEIGTGGNTSKFSYVGSYQYGTPVNVTLHRHGRDAWSITINGRNFGPVRIANAWTVSEFENWHAWPTNSAQYQIQPLKQGSWQAQDWDGWSGPHHFVTDGKEVLTDPMDGKTGDLEAQFRSLHPDAEKVSTGTAYPTADTLGYGVWHEGGDVPIHELIATLDKHLDKPTHLIDDWNAIHDSDRYSLVPN